MSRARLTRLAALELAAAARVIARDNPPAARGLRATVAEALGRLGRYPESGTARPELAAPPVRFWFMQRYPYVLIYDSEARPPLVLRVVHAARDLPALLR
jgi:toxin ParE1/3/4